MAEKWLKFHTVEYPQSKISIRLPRSVVGGYHFWFGCCLVDLNLTEITMETSGSLFPFLIWQRHYVFKNTRGCLLASEYSKTISLIQCSKYKQSLQNYQRSSFGQIWFWKTLKFWFWSTLKWQKLEIYYFFNIDGSGSNFFGFGLKFGLSIRVRVHRVSLTKQFSGFFGFGFIAKINFRVRV